MRVRIDTGFYKGREGVAKPVEESPEEGYGTEYEVDILNPDGSVLQYEVFYGDYEITIL